MAAIELFTGKGYAATTINDILERVGIAKGTFYHHFSAKEDVLRAVVLQIVEQGAARAEQIAAERSRPVPDRVLAIIGSQRLGEADSGLVTSLHEPGNAEFHLLSHIATVNRLTPIIAGVVREGIAEDLFDVAYPEETVAILLTAAAFLTEEGLDDHAPDLDRVMPALIIAAERLFGAAQGTFADRVEILDGD